MSSRTHTFAGLVGRWSLFGSVLTAGLLLGSRQAVAQEPEPVVRVEEDWEMVLLEPNPDPSPQLYTSITPDEVSFWTTVEWNYHWLLPGWTFVAGGYHIMNWTDGDDPVSEVSFDLGAFSGSQTVTWTQVMETNATETAVAVLDGSCLTWGSFGGADTVVYQPK